MKEIHGIADGSRRTAFLSPDDVEVTVTDGDKEIIISVGGRSSGLCPARARFLAAELNRAALRIRKQSKTS